MTDENRLLAASQISNQIIDAGDVALLLKKDGSVQALTFGYDRNRLLQPVEDHTEEDKLMADQGRKLFALAFAAGHPKLMQVLLDIAADPDVVDFETLAACSTRH